MYSFFCSVKDWPESGYSINALSAGKAKSAYHADIKDSYPNLPYTAIKSRKEGLASTSAEFKSMAEYRNIPFAKCGMAVRFQNGATGLIAGHNASANLDVLFTSGEHTGLILNCHPHHQIEYLTNKGEVIKSFFTA